MHGADQGVDLVVTDSAGRPVAAVELKNRQDLNRDVAVQLRRNLAAHDALGNAPYFLLLSEDTGFVWKNAPANEILALPAAEFPMRSVVGRYSSGPSRPRRLRDTEFSALVFRWLQSLTRSTNGIADPAEMTLKEAGLLDAMRGGSVADQVLV